MPPNDSWIACCFRTTLARILRSEVTIAAQVSSVVRGCQRTVQGDSSKRSAPAELSKPRTTSGRADEKTRRAAGVMYDARDCWTARGLIRRMVGRTLRAVATSWYSRRLMAIRVLSERARARRVGKEIESVQAMSCTAFLFMRVYSLDERGQPRDVNFFPRSAS